MAHKSNEFRKLKATKHAQFSIILSVLEWTAKAPAILAMHSLGICFKCTFLQHNGDINHSNVKVWIIWEHKK